MNSYHFHKLIKYSRAHLLLNVRYSQFLTLSTLLPCRYYYDKNIILKTAGKRYVYRFVCDLQGLLGYSPEEIHQMVDLKLEKKDED